MKEQHFSISSLRSGGVITNYFCSSSCRHCLYRCSPQWPKEYISAETARKNFESIGILGCRAIHIGGGEPFLRPQALGDILEMAAATGLYVEYVETNSSWFRDEDDACAILERLGWKGLTTLLVSISPFHNESIPLSNVKGVIAACRRTGISVFPWISDFLSDLCVFDEEHVHSIEEYQQHFGQAYLETLSRRYWISPGGRALETFGAFAAPQSIEQIIAEQRGGCAELAEVGHFHLDLYGNYIPGLCAGLSIRRDDLGQPLEPEEYPILSRLFSGGIGAFLAYAVEGFGFHASDQGYTSKCHLCYAIRRFLVVERELDSHELQPRGHYLYG